LLRSIGRELPGERGAGAVAERLPRLRRTARVVENAVPASEEHVVGRRVVVGDRRVAIGLQLEPAVGGMTPRVRGLVIHALVLVPGRGVLSRCRILSG